MQSNVSGAPNENIVQNHLNQHLFISNQYLNGRYGHIFIPQKFFICSDFLAESLVIRKLQGSKLTFSKISARKKAPENSRRPFQGKNPLKTGNYTILGGGRKSQERQASKKFNNKCYENSRSQIIFRTDIFQNSSLGAPYVFLRGRIFNLVIQGYDKRKELFLDVLNSECLACIYN